MSLFSVVFFAKEFLSTTGPDVRWRNRIGLSVIQIAENLAVMMTERSIRSLMQQILAESRTYRQHTGFRRFLFGSPESRP
ncbi:hypothetical protein AND_010053 [Anopheles darlingi]|uniref:Uncharacterized protein n=1 Tax=Anopheles darlingi TaxID=43151 RepID=W5J3K5_ANODA|nr:hypothetical protein AND_010053 [Anopheles darlingi]